MKGAQISRSRRVLLVVLLALAAVSVAIGFRNGLRFKDFHWESAALFLQGENPYRWFFDGRSFQGVGVDATQAPSTIAFILPYGFFSHYVGNLLWDVTNLVFLGVFWAFMWRTFFAADRVSSVQAVERPLPCFLGASFCFWTLFAVFAMGNPCRVCIGNGQHGLMSLACFAAAYWAMERGKSFWLVGLLMAGSLFKYTFAVPLAFIFLFHRQWKAMAVCAGIHVVLTAALGWWTGTNPIALVVQSMEVGVALITEGGEADWAGFANWLGVADVSGVALAGYAFFGALLFLCALTGPQDSLLKLSTFAVIANVMFYHRVYDFMTLIFPLVYAVRNLADRSRLGVSLRWAIFANVALTFFAERIGWHSNQPWYIPCCVVAEHALLALLLLKGFRGR